MGARELLDDLARDGFSIAADGDRLLIRPASKLTDDRRNALRAAKPELVAILSGAANDPTRTCRSCLNRLPYGTCREPREAGLIDGGEPFGIRWAPEGYAAACTAFAAKAAATP